MSSARAVVAAYVEALTHGDEDAARACCTAAAWASPHGDNPQRFFRKASDAKRGFRVELGPVQLGGGDGEVCAAETTLFRRNSGPEARPIARMSLLCAAEEGAAEANGSEASATALAGQNWQVVGVCKADAWRDAYLRGQVPALLVWEQLPPHEDASNAFVALCALGNRAKAGVGEAAAMLTAWMNEDAVAGRVILRVQHLIAQGYRLRVRDSRWLPKLGRAVVQVEVRAADADTDAELHWLIAEVGPPLRWLAMEELLRTEALVAPAAAPAG